MAPDPSILDDLAPLDDSTAKYFDEAGEVDEEALDQAVQGDSPDLEDRTEEATTEAPAEEPAEEPAQEATEEPAAAEAEAEAEETPEQPKETPRVPLPELLEERKARQAMAAENAEMKERMARMEGAFGAVVQGMQGQPGEEAAPEVEPAPDYEEDPAAWLRWSQENTAREVEALKANSAETAQQQEASGQQQQFYTAIQTAEQHYTQEKPDYPQALAHIQRFRMGQFLAMGMKEEEAQQALLGDTLFTAENSFRAGKNPAEVMYNLALATGYGAAEAPADPAPASDPTPAPVAEADPVPAASAETQVERLQKGAEASSAMAGGGGEDHTNLTLEGLSKLEGPEFDKAWATMQKKGLLG